MKNLSIFLSLLVLFAGCADKTVSSLSYKVQNSCTYYSLQRAECLSKAAFIDAVKPYKVIFVGDHHSSANAHKIVIELIDELSHSGFTVLLANEWFSPADNALLKQYIDGRLDANVSKALNWKQHAGYDLVLYEPIYDAVRDNHGQLYGVNMSREFEKKISDQNLSAMSEKERLFYDQLDLNVTVHKEMLSSFFSHCHSLKKGESQQQCSERMYRVQVAWDSMMGEESAKLSKTLKANEKLIVFIGAMHLESGIGANMRFARKTDIPSITILPWPKSTKEKNTIDVGLGSSDMIYLYDAEI